jgi:hypothetical protein
MTKVQDMTADTAPDRAGVIYYVDDPAGTPLDRKVTVANLVKNGVTRYCTLTIFDKDTAPSTGNGKNFISIPPDVSGMNLTYVFASFMTVGSGQSTAASVMVRNATDSQDMLSTAITIDANELDSSSAATAAVINTSYDDVITNDQIQIDVDAVPSGGTAAKGLYVTLGFSWPT